MHPGRVPERACQAGLTAASNNGSNAEWGPEDPHSCSTGGRNLLGRSSGSSSSAISSSGSSGGSGSFSSGSSFSSSSSGSDAVSSSGAIGNGLGLCFDVSLGRTAGHHESGEGCNEGDLLVHGMYWFW